MFFWGIQCLLQSTYSAIYVLTFSHCTGQSKQTDSLHQEENMQQIWSREWAAVPDHGERRNPDPGRARVQVGGFFFLPKYLKHNCRPAPHCLLWIHVWLSAPSSVVHGSPSVLSVRHLLHGILLWERSHTRALNDLDLTKGLVIFQLQVWPAGFLYLWGLWWCDLPVMFILKPPPYLTNCRTGM